MIGTGPPSRFHTCRFSSRRRPDRLRLARDIAVGACPPVDYGDEISAVPTGPLAGLTFERLARRPRHRIRRRADL